MSALERMLRAELSSDLSHKEHACDVDVLMAVGFAAIHNSGHLAVFRVKYLNDVNSLDEAGRQFTSWARSSMIKRNQELYQARKLAWLSLRLWVNDQCTACNGLKYIKLKDSPCLSATACKVCGGSGKKVVSNEITKDLIERADAVVYQIHRQISHKLHD